MTQIFYLSPYSTLEIYSQKSKIKNRKRDCDTQDGIKPEDQ